MERIEEEVRVRVEDQVKDFKTFLEHYYKKDVLENIRKGISHLEVDFLLLIKYSPDLSELLLDNPEEVLKAFSLAFEEFDDERKLKDPKIRLKNLSQSQDLMISGIRSKHLNKLFNIKGIIRQKSDVRPLITSTRFECPACSNILTILQLEKIMRQPTKCSCGRKGKFKLLSKNLIDAQGMVLEEDPSTLKGHQQPKRINVILKDDLTSPLSEIKTSPGSVVTITGFIKEVKIESKTGGTLTRMDYILEANNLKCNESSFYDLKISESEKAEILKLSEDPDIYNKLIDSLVPSIYGYKNIKEAIIMQLVGGVRKIKSDKVTSRGDIHILLLGDPGAGKSAMVRRIGQIAPKGRYVTGKGASGVGLTACIVRDDFTKGFAIEAGAMVLSNEGICTIDEFDKMSEEDKANMHEAMEDQTVSISKANIQATLNARTTILASANPKHGRFDSYDLISAQIDLPPALINRFDLIFIIKDDSEVEKDRAIAKHILQSHENPKAFESPISDNILKKYIAYARQNIKPKLTKEALQEMEDYYMKMRSMSTEENGIKTIPISPRQLQALVRMAEASAKITLSQEVKIEHAKKAISLLQNYLESVGFDKETGQIDIDRVATGQPASERKLIYVVRDIADDMFLENKTIEMEELVQRIVNKGYDKNKIEDCIEKLKRHGELFEPKNGWIMKVA